MSSSSRGAAPPPPRPSSCCRGVTKQGTSCSISQGLSVDGFCKFHVPNSRQCLGTSRSSGQRCRIHWDLDAAGYCAHHRVQTAAPAPALPAITDACRGLTKRGSPCSITWGLDADGFCKYHAPSASQCRGLARATGRRCRVKWGLDDLGYCQFHRRVAAPAARQCEALLARGRRCAQTVGIDVDGFCTAHRAVKKGLPLCRGVLLGSGELCRNNAKVDYDYCCAAHDPEFAASFVAPSLFNDPGLRNNVEGNIVKQFKGRDLYHGDKLELNTVGAVELDHILEKQCFAYAFQRVAFRGGDEEAQDVAFMLREEVVNELPNLCLTRATTNKIKGAAVSRFLDDSLTGHRGSKTFTDYLLAQKRDGTRLVRDVTRTIRSEMGSALRRCQRKLADAGETPALEALSAELQQLYVHMGLLTPHNSKMKPRAAIPVAVEMNIDDKDDEYVMVNSVAVDSWTVVDFERSAVQQPALSADAEPFVPGAIRLTTSDAQTSSKVAGVTVKCFNVQPDEVEMKVSGVSRVVDVRAKSVKQEATSRHRVSKHPSQPLKSK